MTKNFSLQELTRSITATERSIDNTPPADVLPALQATAEGLERIREKLGGHRIRVTSGFRCAALNAAVGGVPTSQHVKGEAVDFVCSSYGSPLQILRALAPHVRELGIDQIINEGNWVHVSFKESPRGLVMRVVDGKVIRGLA